MNALDLAARGLARRALQAQQTLASNGGAEQVGTSFGYSAQQRMGETVSILEAVGAGTHNAVLAGTNDDDHVAAIQALVDQLSTAGGGIIEVPAKGSARFNFGSPLVPKNNVGLRGALHQGVGPTYGATLYGGNAFPLFEALPGCPWIIESSEDTLSQFSVAGIKFEGVTGGGGGGIHIPDALRGGIVNCAFRFFDEQAIWGGRIQCWLIQDGMATNCLQNHARSELAGVLQIDDLIDSHIIRGEYGASLYDPDTGHNSGLTGADMYCAAVVTKGGSNSWILDVIGELADVAFDVATPNLIMRGCRGDLSGGHGFRIRGTDGQYTGNKSFRSGQDADAIYSDFHVEPGAIRNMFIGNQGDSVASDPNRVLHIVEDAGSTFASPNTYLGTFGINQRGSTYSFPAGGANAANVAVLQGFPEIFPNGDTTPSVDNQDKFQWLSPSAVSVTMFNDGVPGQTMTIRSNVGATVTIVHNAANIVNLNAANRILIANRDYQYCNVGGVWYEQPHQHGISGGAATTSGDADATLTANGSTTRRWTSALTADRTATLSVTGASKGDRLHVVRDAAGAFNLLVVNSGPGAGTLATLAAGTFAIAEFDGTNWFLAAT